MRQALRLCACAILFATGLNAQQVQRPQNFPVASTNHTIGAPQTGGPSGQITGEEIQSAICTDKITYVDRHPQANQPTQVGGYNGWWTVIQTFPNYSGTVTEAYATMRRSGTQTNNVAIWIY